MVKGIYVLKMLLLQDMFLMTPEQLQAVKELAHFFVHIFPLPWFRAPFCADAAYLDLDLWNKLHKYTRYSF